MEINRTDPGMHCLFFPAFSPEFALNSTFIAILDRIAIEEGEAWLLGDRNAVKMAYPRAIDQVLNNYVQDSICGTWEKLADAIYPGGAQQLKTMGWPHIGQTKCEWAMNISPYFDVDANLSKSFQVFRDGIRDLAGMI